MLSLSQTAGYAILALACLEDETNDHWVKARDIAESTGIPMPYLSKILHQLGQAGIVTAKRGTFGGFILAVRSAEISLLEVAEAVEGESWLPKCLLGFADCSDSRACPIHKFWVRERDKIAAVLASTTLKDVARFERHSQGRLGAQKSKPPVRRRRKR